MKGFTTSALIFPALALTGCSTSPGEAPEPALSASIVHLGSSPSKPPVVYHHFNIRLTNPSSAPRWMVFPADFSDADFAELPMGLELTGLLSLYTDESGESLLVHCSEPAFWAVRLPGSGQVDLQEVWVESRQSHPDTSALELLIASDIRLETARLEDLIDQQTPLNAEVKTGQRMWIPKAERYPSGNLSWTIETRQNLRVVLDSQEVVPFNLRLKDDRSGRE